MVIDQHAGSDREGLSGAIPTNARQQGKLRGNVKSPKSVGSGRKVPSVETLWKNADGSLSETMTRMKVVKRK